MGATRHGSRRPRFHYKGGKIVAIDLVAEPERLDAFDVAILGSEQDGPARGAGSP